MLMYQMRKDQEWDHQTFKRMENGNLVEPIVVKDSKLSRFMERHPEKDFFVEVINTIGRSMGFYKVPKTFNCNDIVTMLKQVQEAADIVHYERLKAPKLFGAARKAYEKKKEEMIKVSGPKLETVIEDKPVVFNGLVFNIGFRDWR